MFPHGVEIKSAGGDDYQYTTIYNIQYIQYTIYINIQQPLTQPLTHGGVMPLL